MFKYSLQKREIYRIKEIHFHPASLHGQKTARSSSSSEYHQNITRISSEYHQNITRCKCCCTRIPSCPNFLVSPQLLFRWIILYLLFRAAIQFSTLLRPKHKQRISLQILNLGLIYLSYLSYLSKTEDLSCISEPGFDIFVIVSLEPNFKY